MKTVIITLGVLMLLATVIVLAAMRVSGLESQREEEREWEARRNELQSE